MTGSGRSAAVFAFLLALVTAFMGFVFWRLDSEGESLAWSIVAGVGLVVWILAAALSVVTLRTWRQRVRLLRPDQQIARWQVSPENWEAFRAYEESLRADTQSLPNLVKPGRKPLTQAVEIFAGKGGMLVGGRVFQVEPRGMLSLRAVRWHVGSPECLELVMLQTMAHAYGSTFRLTNRWAAIRVPVEPAQREAAIAAHQFYTAVKETGQISNPRPAWIALWVATALAVIGLPLGALGFWMNAEGIMENTLVPPLLGILGTMGGGCALLFAGIAWTVMLRK